jgi:hypothetical protein
VIDFEAVFGRQVRHVRAVKSANWGLHTLRHWFVERSCVTLDDEGFFVVEEV